MNKNKTKVLFIVPGLGLGGTTTALAGLLNSKYSEEYNVDVFVISKSNRKVPPISSYEIGLNGLTSAYYSDFSRFQTKDKLKYFFIKVIKQSSRWNSKLEQWIITKTIQKIEQRKKYDFVVGFQEKLATQFASHFSCPRKIAWIHCDYAKAYGPNSGELELYEQFTKVVCVSKFTREGFIQLYPSLSEKTIAIHNLFDAERVINNSNATIDDSRFDTSQFTIISLGRISDVKRFYLIPEMVAQIQKEGLRFKWFILGNDNEPKEVKRLNDAIKQYGVEKEVLYLGGKANPYPYLKASDLMVTLSKSEACPMIFNEAKILHIPVLSADFGSAFEFIEQDRDGYILSIEKIPQKLHELINNPALLNSISKERAFQDTNKAILNQLKELFAFKLFF